jgi:hypothetical protein
MERPRDSGETEVKLSLNETSLAQATRKVICAKKKGGPIMKTVSKPLAARRNQDSPISDSLHPLVNMAIIGLVLMFVAAVWIFFASDPYGAWLDVVITGLFVIAIAIPTLCWLTWRRNADGATDGGHPSFHDWAVGEFDTSTGPVKGASATAEVLLPIAAVAVGMTVLGLVFHIIASGGA